MIQRQINAINSLGIKVFLEPINEPFELIIKKGLSGNTYRAFHRIDKSKDGASVIFREYFISNKSKILDSFSKLLTRKNYDSYLDTICLELKQLLQENIKNQQLDSYNKLRKPVDLYIEHIVSMDEDFKDFREKITPFMYLPLDSWIFQNEIIFPNENLCDLGLKRRFSLSAIKSKHHYLKIQEFVEYRAKLLGVKCEIFFDLFWNNRFERVGGNLFELNPS